MKNIQNFLIFLLIPGVMLFTSSCEDNEAPGPSQNPGFKYQIKMDAQSTSINARQAANEINFTAGTIWVDEIDFEAESANEEIEFEREQLTSFDLITGEADPALPMIELTPGTYEEIEFGVSLDDDNAGQALVIEGNFINSNDEEVPFRLEYNKEFEFEVEYDDGVTIDEAQTFLALIQLIPSKWFDNVTVSELENATTNDEGTIIISDSENSDIFNKIVSSLESDDDDLEIEIDFDYDDDDDNDDDDDDDDDDDNDD